MKRLLSNQIGNAKLITVIGIIGLAYLVKTGSVVLGDDVPQTLYWSLVGIIALITAFSLGYSLHMRLLGEKPTKQLHREMLQKSQELDKILQSSSKRAREYEERMVEYFRGLSRRAPDCLSMIKKILRAIDRQNSEAKSLLATRDRIDLISAYELLTGKLEVGGSALEALIDSEPVPALESFEIAPTLERLFKEIDSELQKAIEMHSQLRRVA